MARTLLTNELLQDEVEHAFALDPQMSVRDLTVQVVDDGMVRVQGVVSSLQAARRATERVAQIDGVAAIDNCLAVEAPRGATDTALQQEAQAAVANADPRLSVQVSDSIAILRGEA